MAAKVAERAFEGCSSLEEELNALDQSLLAGAKVIRERMDSLSHRTGASKRERVRDDGLHNSKFVMEEVGASSSPISLPRPADDESSMGELDPSTLSPRSGDGAVPSATYDEIASRRAAKQGMVAEQLKEMQSNLEQRARERVDLDHLHREYRDSLMREREVTAQARAKAHMLEAEVLDLRKKLVLAHRRIHELEGGRSETDRHCAVLAQQLKRSQDEKEALTQEKKAEVLRRERESGLLLEAQAMLKEAKSENEELQERERTAMKEQLECSAKVSEYLIELSELREALRAAQKKIDVMEHERESSLALPGVQRALMDMREMLAEQQRRADAATAENERHRAEARRLEEKATEERERWQAKSTALQEKVSTLQEKLVSEVRDLNALLNEERERSAALEAERAEAVRKLEEAAAGAEELERTRKELEEERTKREKLEHQSTTFADELAQVKEKWQSFVAAQQAAGGSGGDRAGDSAEKAQQEAGVEQRGRNSERTPPSRAKGDRSRSTTPSPSSSASSTATGRTAAARTRAREAQRRVYTPVKNDEIDELLAGAIRHRLADGLEFLPPNFARLTRGIYRFGTKRIHISAQNGEPRVRVGGGSVPFPEYVKQHGKLECVKMNRSGLLDDDEDDDSPLADVLHGRASFA